MLLCFFEMETPEHLIHKKMMLPDVFTQKKKIFFQIYIPTSLLDNY